MVQLRRLLTLSPVRIAGGYLVFGVLWILLSDQIVLFITETPAQSASLQTVKGWLFVLGSAALILGLTRTRELQVRSSRQRLDRASQELQVLHRVFRHNIRNDLTVVGGYLDMAHDVVSDEEVSEWLTTAATSTDQILATSDKLRVIERPDLSTASGSSSVDLVDLVRRECDRLETSHSELTIDTELPEHARIRGDQSLAHVLQEIFENAVEHHDLPKDQQQLSVAVEKSLGGVTLRIADNGPGIPRDELTALERGEETDLVHVSGVGLWLVKWLCSFYDGEVAIETDASDGTVVSIDFEAASPLESLAGRAWDGGQAETVA